MEPVTVKLVHERFEKAHHFNSQVGLYDTVKNNENYFIGNQWEGVESNGLPTPVFHFLKRVTLFQVATITSDNMTMQASPLISTSKYTEKELEEITEIINRQFESIFERNRIVTKLREFMRNSAVDGDGCLYFFFDPNIENGQLVKGEICAEIVENTRVYFGNQNQRDPQKQPWIIIARRMLLEDARYLAKEKSGRNPAAVVADSDIFQNKYDSYTDDKVTVLTYFYRNRDTETIWSCECTEKVMLKDPYDTGLKLYPLVWLCWDYIPDCYHGQGLITGLIPNQDFLNKIFALTMISIMTTAFPKIIFDSTRIEKWDGSVGSAIGVNGSINDVAKVMDPASVSPQIAQFINLCIETTQSFMGASDVAMGDSRPDNTSAIIALQRASNTPMEMTKQALYQSVEDMGRIFLDIMRSKYGTRYVQTKLMLDEPGAQPLGMQLPAMTFVKQFDFSILEEIPLSIKLDVGASSYWSEIASMQTLDNLLMQNKITLLQYLERIPQGYVSKKQELIDALKGLASGTPLEGGAVVGAAQPSDIPVQGGPGNGALQRSLNKTGVV